MTSLSSRPPCKLRERFNDTLVGLVRSEQRLAAAGGADTSETLRELLEFETGSDWLGVEEEETVI